MEFGDGELSTQGKKNREARKSTKLTGTTNRMEEQKKKTEWGKKNIWNIQDSIQLKKMSLGKERSKTMTRSVLQGGKDNSCAM